MNLGSFRGQARRLDDIDIPRVASRLGVGEDELHAVMDVEAAGSGFDAQGRPKMLFEPHIFWRELGPGQARDAAAAQGLAYASWRPGAYPADSYPRLVNAMRLNARAALRSASWGRGQVMGFNHSLAGYDSAEEMVAAFMEDEETHLDAMASFILAAGLDDELRRHDWAGFARGYNGAGYARNGYHTRLAARFAWWRKKPDTPWAPGQPEPRPNGAEARLALMRPLLERLLEIADGQP